MAHFGQFFLDRTGFRFFHHLYLYENGVGTHYRSRAELQRCDRYFATFILQRDSRLKRWSAAGHRANSRARLLLQKFSDSSSAPPSFSRSSTAVYTTLLYGVTAPFLVLSALDSITEEKRSGDLTTWTQRLFEPLRNDSLYPQLERVVLRYYWRKAADFPAVKTLRNAQCLTPVELGNLLNNSKNSGSVKTLQQRYRYCVFWNDTRNKRILFSYDPVIGRRLPQEQSQGDVVHGTPAFQGRVHGRACIVNAPQDMKKLRKNDVLVSFATNPTLMPALRACSAIVTDEGGMMCHAAIVSRELKKPCIVGTKIATRVFRDGDIIDIDATNGVAKVVKRKS